MDLEGAFSFHLSRLLLTNSFSPSRQLRALQTLQHRSRTSPPFFRHLHCASPDCGRNSVAILRSGNPRTAPPTSQLMAVSPDFQATFAALHDSIDITLTQ